MTTVNIHEAKARLSSLIKRAQDGEEIVIAKRNCPLVKLVVVEEAREKRSLGWAKGKIAIPEDFDTIPDDFSDYV